MNTAASFEFDRKYFAMYYTSWLNYRSRWRRFAIPIAASFLLVTVIAAILLPQQRALAIAFVLIAVVNCVDACSHRWRWIRERLKSQSREKQINLLFNDDDVAIQTPNSNGSMRYTAFINVTMAPDGIFLVPDTGISIFVPRSAFQSDDDFRRVADTVKAKHASS